MINAIIIFTIATVINVTLSTIRSLCTINGGKWLSATTNAICYGFYPLIVMLTAQGTVDIIINMCITAVANFVCVWIIKFVEEKARKDKLWKVEMAIPFNKAEYAISRLKNVENTIPFNYQYLGKWCVFNCYCATQEHTEWVKDLSKTYGGKISAYESQKLI
jgi:hypothetical protein